MFPSLFRNEIKLYYGVYEVSCGLVYVLMSSEILKITKLNNVSYMNDFSEQ